MMGEVVDMVGKEFKIDTVMKLGGATHYNGEAPQKVTITKTIRKGQIWKDVSEMIASEGIFEDCRQIKWKLKEVTRVGEDQQKLLFEPILPPEEPKKDLKAYKEILAGLDLHKESIKEMMKNMLLNVFTVNMLKKLLKSERIEFVIDTEWMYLKSGKTAYRV